MVGFMFSSILMNVLTTAMNTLVVCFAESPDEFKANHPHLYKKMEKRWISDMEDSSNEGDDRVEGSFA